MARQNRAQGALKERSNFSDQEDLAAQNCSLFELEQRPCIGHSLESVCAAADGGDHRSGERIAHGLTHEDLARCRQFRDTGSDVNCEAGEVVVLVLDLTEVDATS